jgi:hypothetical protein
MMSIVHILRGNNTVFDFLFDAQCKDERKRFLNILKLMIKANVNLNVYLDYYLFKEGIPQEYNLKSKTSKTYLGIRQFYRKQLAHYIRIARKGTNEKIKVVR